MAAHGGGDGEMPALFELAAAAVRSLPRFSFSALPRDSERLMLYGLYKQATAGAQRGGRWWWGERRLEDGSGKKEGERERHKAVMQSTRQRRPRAKGGLLPREEVGRGAHHGEKKPEKNGTH